VRYGDAYSGSKHIDDCLDYDVSNNKALGDDNTRHMNYTVLSLNGIREHQHNATQSASNVFVVSETEVAILLRYLIGILLMPTIKGLQMRRMRGNMRPKKKKESTTCLICLDDYKISHMIEL